MIVTVICDVLGAPNNGTSVAAFHLIEALQKAGDEVRVVCPDKEHKGEKSFYILPRINFGPFQPIVDHNGVGIARPVEATLLEAVEGADEIHSMLPFFTGIKTAKIAKEKGIPLSAGFHVQAENVTAHFFDFIKWKWLNKEVYRWLWKHFFQYVDRIHYPTSFIQGEFEKAIGRKTPGTVISNGVSADFHPLPKDRPASWGDKFVIVMTGRYSKEKNQKVLLKAVSRSRYKDRIKLILAGSGPRVKGLMKLAKKYHEDVEFAFYSHPELVKLLSNADLYVHASPIEIEAISCLEAISAGLVPLINDSPLSATPSFALSPDNLFKKNDYRDLAKKIDMFIEHPEKLEEGKKAYSSYAKQFDFDLCMGKMVEFIHSCAALKGKKE